MRSRILMTLAIALTVGCQGGSPVSVKGTPRPQAANGKKAVDASARVPLGDARRVVDAADLTSKTKLATAELTGKVKLISDKGLGIVSNNSGGLISDHGGGLISDHGAGIVANNGGGLVSKTKYRLLEAKQESLLAEAQIEVLDAAGQVLVDKAGKPIGAISDGKGGYRLRADLPTENLILRVRLWQGGQLFAILPKDRRNGELDLDTASSVGARFVLDRFVNGDQRVFDRLPATEAEALRREIEAARGLLGDGVPSYRPADLVAAGEQLRTKDVTVGKRIETIRALLLAGQADLGTGRKATEVSLSVPNGVVGDAQGNLYVAEIGAFRVRKIAPDGTISVLAGTGARDARGMLQGQTLEAVGGIALGADGDLYVTQQLSGQVRKIAKDGTMSTIFGTSGGLSYPAPLVVAADGAVYVGEVPRSGDRNGRVLMIKDGIATDVSPPRVGRAAYPGLALAADGSLYALDMQAMRLFRRPPGGAWVEHATIADANPFSRIWLDADGSVLVALPRIHTIVRVTPDGKAETIAGTGEQGLDGDGGPARAARLSQPAGMWRSPAGELYVADADGLVRKIAKDGTISTVAGTTGLVDGDARSLAVNGPGGLTLDLQGRLVFSESGGSTVKRLDGRTLVNIVGSGAGYAGDDGPATAAKLHHPTGVGYGPDGTLYVLDTANSVIREVTPGGTIRTIVTDAPSAIKRAGGPYAPGKAAFFNPVFLTVSPKGELYWSDAKGHQIWRRLPGGQCEVVAGRYEQAGDPASDKPARECQLHTPYSLAFDAKGDLYVGATGNSRVLRIAGGDPQSRIETVVGLTPEKFFERALGEGGGGLDVGDGGLATDAMLFGPTAIAFGPDGALYVAELGTSKLTSFGLDSFGKDFSIPPELLASLPKYEARIRRITADGRIATVAGHGTRVLNDPASDDMLLYPLAMLFDRESRLIVADSALNQIKVLAAGSF